ncbi:heavy metal transporter [Micromonospora sp. NBC_01699]|uniref:heavy-metal-associated domain-containing protein n=1 Tax=Micromonospora sp. NBC_01699 TaxID=2975984 RepID=UPI002E2CAFDF|nr:heavy-metal-associated domain-containing protein [Micromonospora sp. NBC_01699]
MHEAVTYHLIVSGLSGVLDAVSVNDTLQGLPGVHHAHTSARTGRCVVDADPTTCDPQQLATALTIAGYPTEVEHP